MGEGFYVVTATKVHETGKIDFTFMSYSGMPRSAIWANPDYGVVTRKVPSKDRISVATLQGEKRPEGLRCWDIQIGNSGKWKACTGADEVPENEAGLAEFLPDIVPAILLMERGDFPDFEKACATAGLPVEVFHFDGELSTSQVLQRV